MREAVRQTIALAGLLSRHWARSSMVSGKAPAKGGSRGWAGVLLRLLFAGLMAQVFFSAGARAGEVRDRTQATVATSWLLIGLFTYVAAVALTLDAPEIPGARYPLRRPLLGQLPLRPSARVAFVLLQEWIVFPPAIFGVIGAAHAAPLVVLRATAVGLVLFFSAALSGIAVTSTLRLLLPAHRVARLTWIALPFLIAGPVTAVSGPLFARWSRIHTWDPTIALARALLQGNGVLPALVILAAPGVVGALVFALAERIGYDRIDAAPPRPPAASRSIIDLANLDRVLAGRELGVRAMIIPILFTVFGSSMLALGFRRQLAKQVTAPRPELPAEALALVGFFVAQLAASLALTRAGRGVLRDAQARPLLASLPIAAADTLRGKAAALRPQILPIVLVYVPWLIVAPGLFRLEFAWRAVFAGVALWYFAEAAVSVSFLTNGLGAPGGRSSGQPLSLGSVLLALPFFGVCLAPSPFAALIALGSLLALAFEAKRSAMRCLDLVDDADDSLRRETETWRALLVLAGFYAVQSLGGRLFGAFAPTGSEMLVSGATSLASSAALVLLTQSEGVTLSSFRLLPSRIWFLPLGILAGALTGSIAAGYTRLTAVFGVAAHPQPGNWVARSLVAVAVLVAAPIAEELFFRGWLQRAVTSELPVARRRLAVVITALAFAAAHPPSSFVPTLILGLVCGLLLDFSGALLAGILAHAAHDAVVLFLGG